MSGEFGKRSRMNITRAGVVPETFFVCYNCPAELTEEQTTNHLCTEGQD